MTMFNKKAINCSINSTRNELNLNDTKPSNFIIKKNSCFTVFQNV